MKTNEVNKKFWDDIFAEVPPTNDTDCCHVCCEDEDGHYVPATPLGYDDDMKEYSAVKDLTENSIKDKSYKCWKIGSTLFDTYAVNKIELCLFDVIYVFTSDWEIPKFPVLITEVDEKEHTITVAFIDNRKDEVIKNKLNYKDPEPVKKQSENGYVGKNLGENLVCKEKKWLNPTDKIC